MTKFFDPQNPFYRPLWIRVVIVAVCLFWAVVEFTNGNGVWAMLFAGAGVYCIWVFLVTYQPPPEDKGET